MRPVAVHSRAPRARGGHGRGCGPAVLDVVVHLKHGTERGGGLTASLLIKCHADVVVHLKHGIRVRIEVRFCADKRTSSVRFFFSLSGFMLPVRTLYSWL